MTGELVSLREGRRGGELARPKAVGAGVVPMRGARDLSVTHLHCVHPWAGCVEMGDRWRFFWTGARGNGGLEGARWSPGEVYIQ